MPYIRIQKCDFINDDCYNSGKNQDCKNCINYEMYIEMKKDGLILKKHDDELEDWG